MTSANAGRLSALEPVGRWRAHPLLGCDQTGCRPPDRSIPLTGVVAWLLVVPPVTGCIAVQERIRGRRARILCLAARAAGGSKGYTGMG
jgi:hypothetical protein